MVNVVVEITTTTSVLFISVCALLAVNFKMKKQGFTVGLFSEKNDSKSSSMIKENIIVSLR